MNSTAKATRPVLVPAVDSPIGADDRPTGRGPAWCFLGAPIAIGLALAGRFVGVGATPTQIVGVVLVALWAGAGVSLGLRRRHERSSPIVLFGAALGGGICLARAVVAAHPDHRLASIGLRLTIALLPATVLHFSATLPDGRLRRRGVAAAIVGFYAVAGAVGGFLCTDLDAVRAWPVVALWTVALVGGGSLAAGRYRAAGSIDRRRMQWIAWGVTVALEAMLVLVALRLLTQWPDSAGTAALATTALVPIAVIAGTAPRMVAQVDRLLTRTVELAGLTALVMAVYVVVVLGLGRAPDGGERSLLLLSMIAAALAALLYVPARTWLTARANRLVYGARVAPDDALRNFGQRMTRAIPLDELLLQLTENLRTSMVLLAAEVWTGHEGVYELVAGVPHRRPPPIEIGPTELPVVARAGVSGGTWLDIWLPQLVGPAAGTSMRVAPIAHAGLLLGFIAVTRQPDGEPFSDTEDTVLTEIARQIALALHNVQLDAALQASLDELRLRNRELQESRARIVSAGDAERRKLERNLHDGAQQHLVALAVKLRLASDAVEDDPEDAISMIAEIKGDVQTAITELRALAHGIFPPLLVSGGLSDALPSTAGRAALPTTVELDNVGRYGNDVEAAVYFCTVEALQNAGKHAGEGASAFVRVTDAVGVLRFEISDDGVGFDASSGAVAGHGFVNMADRLGAIGGTIAVTSSPDAGTTIIGTIPLPTEV